MALSPTRWGEKGPPLSLDLEIAWELPQRQSTWGMSQSFAQYTVKEPNLEAVEARYAQFHEQLSGVTTTEACLTIIAEWDALLCEFKEWSTLTEIRFHQNTSDPDYKQAKDRLDEVTPKFTDLETTFKQALLEHPLRESLIECTGKQLFERWQCNTRSFSPAIEDDLIVEMRLQSDYTALIGGAKVSFQNKDYTLSEMGQFFDDAERPTREGAYRAHSQWFADNADELDQLYDQQVKVRQKMAEQLGYATFTELCYQRMTRIGYGPQEVATFRKEVRDKVVPLATEIAQKQAKTLKVDQLMFWDSSVYSLGGNPAPLGDSDWMIERASEMFNEMGHGLDHLFDEMKGRGFMDLNSRTGKAGGGFCEFLPKLGYPFIFANFNGTRGDVDVFTHEMGHAFQSYQSRQQAMSDLIWPTTEACEIHSMALEFLTWPHMDKFYGAEAAEELRRIHLTSYFHFLPYGVSIDHFQHMVYDNPGASVSERNEMWQEVEATYMPWIHYGDLPHEASGRRWQQKQHLYMCPFYYIDYCLALTGALQFWSKSITNFDQSMANYTELCKLGGSLDYSGLLDSAGLQSPFKEGCLDEVVADAKRYLAS